MLNKKITRVVYYDLKILIWFVFSCVFFSYIFTSITLWLLLLPGLLLPLLLNLLLQLHC